MQALNAHERRLAGLTRAARAAIVVPSLFALALLVIRQPEMAGFAVLGTFAHLTLINYDTAGAVRFAQSAMLTLLGAVLLSLGALAAANVWLAVGGAVAVGFLSEFPPLARGRVAAIRGGLLLAFMCAVAAPAPAGAGLRFLAGWLLAGVIVQPALLLIWIPLRGRGAAEEGSCSHAVSAVAHAGRANWTGNAVRAGVALGLAVLLARLVKAEHAFWVVLGVLPVLNAGGRSAARTFWHEQAGALIGFSVGAVVVAIIGSHQVWYWVLLPFIVFCSAYGASAVGLVAGQAAFTVFAVALFCILLPQQKDAGILRIEDIAVGGAVSLALASLQRHMGCGPVERWRTVAKARI